MLGRAKTLMRGWVGPAPLVAVPYNVACANGHRLRGERTEGYQALRCPSCGEAVFVLPRSPLPEPAIPAVARRRPVGPDVGPADADDAPHALVDPPSWAATQAEPPSRPASAGKSPGAEVDIEWTVEAVPPPANRPAAPPRPSPVPPARDQSIRPAQTTPAAAATIHPKLTWGEWATRHRNPLLAAALVLIVVGAVSVKRWRQRLEDLPRVVELGRTDGMRKLDAGEFFAAKKILADASAAVDALGGRVEGADAIRQAAREAAIFTDLVPTTLEDLVEEAMTFREGKDWPGHFAAMYRGRSILLETTITAVPDPAKPGSRYEDDYRIYAGRGDKPVATGQIAYGGFELFDLARPRVGEAKTFGARLAALEYHLDEDRWVITLEPASGVFITHAVALEALHWPAGESPEEPQP